MVAIDDPALALLTRYRDELFPGVSVVFAGVSDYRRYMESGRGKITGVVEKQDVQNTLETALSFHPEAKTVLVINDNTVSGVSTRRDAEALRPLFAGRVDIRFLPPSTFDEARTAIGELPPDAIVLIHSYSTDRVGKALSTRETTRLVVTAANIPVYTLHKHRLGDGVVGGFLLDGEKHGRMAADLAIRVLMGMDASTIPVEDTSTSRPMFDFVQLKRFGIPLDKLPKDSVVLNKPVTVFETHAKFAFGVLLAVAFLSLLVALLVTALLRLKRAEEALRLTQYCVDKSPIAFCMVSEEGKIETGNESMCRHLGYAPEEFSKLTVFNFDPAIDPCKFKEHWDMVHSAGFRTLETVHRRKDGTTFPVEVTINHLNYKGRDVVYSFSKDISERKAAEREQAGLREQLFQSQKMETVGLLAGGVAHDFNNLLTAIMGYSELMMTDLPDGDPIRKKLEQIQQAADLARVLTMRLLAFSRKQVLRLDVVDVGGHRPRPGAGDPPNDPGEHPDRVLVGGEPGLVHADKGQIEQVLMNLAVNARDAMPGGGTLTIETRNVDLDESYASAHPAVVARPVRDALGHRHRRRDGRGDPARASSSRSSPRRGRARARGWGSRPCTGS